MLNCDNASIRETATITRPINLIDDRGIHVAATQKISVQ